MTFKIFLYDGYANLDYHYYIDCSGSCNTGPRNIIINVIKDLQDFGQKYATIFYINSMQNFYEISKI